MFRLLAKRTYSDSGQYTNEASHSVFSTTVHNGQWRGLTGQTALIPMSTVMPMRGVTNVGSLKATNCKMGTKLNPNFFFYPKQERLCVLDITSLCIMVSLSGEGFC